EQLVGRPLDECRDIAGELDLLVDIDDHGRAPSALRRGVPVEALSIEQAREGRALILGRDLKLRCDEAGCGELSRRRIDGTEEVENRRRLQRPLADAPLEIGACARAITVAHGPSVVGAPKLGQLEERLFELARMLRRAGLLVEQYRLDDGAQVSADTESVVVERRCDTGNVVRRRVARDQPLNQEL